MRSDRPAGFTLLEVLIAFAIAALVLALLYRGAGTGVAAMRAAGAYQEALSRARSHIALVGRTVPLAPGERSGDDGDGFRWRLRVTPIATAPSSQEGGGPGATLFAVEVAIGWHRDIRPREVTLRSLRIGTSASP